KRHRAFRYLLSRLTVVSLHWVRGAVCTEERGDGRACANVGLDAVGEAWRTRPGTGNFACYALAPFRALPNGKLVRHRSKSGLRKCSRPLRRSDPENSFCCFSR